MPKHVRFLHVLRFLAIVLTLPACGFAQTRPEFEVAAIKPNTGVSRNMSIVPRPGGRLDAENVTLKFLIRLAYKVSDIQIEGGPSWISSARFDIVAKAEAGTPFPDLYLLLQTLIESRFRLAFHRETKELPVYLLVAAKGGLKLPAAEDIDCSAQPALACGTIRMTGKRLDSARITMDALTRALSDITGGIIVDQTGFPGHFNAHLEWSPDEDADGPSFFTALQEQLGLKLESRKARAEVLVIDRAEKPTGN